MSSSNGKAPSNRFASQTEARDPLSAEIDRLNDCWKKAEEELLALKCPLIVWIRAGKPRSEDDEMTGEPEFEYQQYLGLAKAQKQWRLCHYESRYCCESGRLDTTDGVPIVECPTQLRVDMVPHYSALREAVTKAKAEYVPKVAKAVEMLRSQLGVFS